MKIAYTLQGEKERTAPKTVCIQMTNVLGVKMDA